MGSPSFAHNQTQGYKHVTVNKLFCGSKNT
jgi:hypothetical protein